MPTVNLLFLCALAAESICKRLAQLSPLCWTLLSVAMLLFSLCSPIGAYNRFDVPIREDKQNTFFFTRVQHMLFIALNPVSSGEQGRLVRMLRQWPL